MYEAGYRKKRKRNEQNVLKKMIETTYINSKKVSHAIHGDYGSVIIKMCKTFTRQHCSVCVKHVVELKAVKLNEVSFRISHKY